MVGRRIDSLEGLCVCDVKTKRVSQHASSNATNVPSSLSSQAMYVYDMLFHPPCHAAIMKTV